MHATRLVRTGSLPRRNDKEVANTAREQITHRPRESTPNVSRCLAVQLASLAALENEGGRSLSFGVSVATNGRDWDTGRLR